VPYECGYVANHVRAAATSVVQATAEDFSAYFRGEYVVYDHAKFENLRKDPIYCPGGDPAEFARQFGDLCQHILCKLLTFRLFYAVCREEEPRLEAVRATLVRRLWAEGGAVRAFLDDTPTGAVVDDSCVTDLRLASDALLLGLRNVNQMANQQPQHARSACR
jgi:hypothetical protein